MPKAHSISTHTHTHKPTSRSNAKRIWIWFVGKYGDDNLNLTYYTHGIVMTKIEIEINFHEFLCVGIFSNGIRRERNGVTNTTKMIELLRFGRAAKIKSIRKPLPFQQRKKMIYKKINMKIKWRNRTRPFFSLFSTDYRRNGINSSQWVLCSSTCDWDAPPRCWQYYEIFGWESTVIGLVSYDRCCCCRRCYHTHTQPLTAFILFIFRSSFDENK